MTKRLFPVCGAIALLALGAVWSAVFWLTWCLGFILITRSTWYQNHVVRHFKDPNAAIVIDVAALSVCPVLVATLHHNLAAAVSLLITIIGLQLLGAAFRNAPRLGLLCASPTLVPIFLAIHDNSISAEVATLGGLTLLGFAAFIVPAAIFSRGDRKRVELAYEEQLEKVRKAQKLAEGALRSSEQAAAENSKQFDQLREILNSIPIGVGVYDEDDRLQDWNGGYVRAAKDAKIKLVKGKTFAELVATGMDNSASNTDPAVKAAFSKRMAARKSGRTIDQLQKSGRWYQVKDRKLPSGGVVSIASDITELKLREDLSSALFDHSPVPLWIVNSVDPSFIRVNDAAIALFGWSREEFATLRMWDLLAPSEHNAFVTEMATHKGFKTHASPRAWAYRTSTGAALLIKSQAAMVTTVDGKAGCMWAMWDVTAQVKAEKRLVVKSRLAARVRRAAERSSAAKSEFLAMMSHELRTPLNGVLGTAQALALTSLADEQSRHVQTILESGRSLKIVLNDVLDLSKIEAGRMDIVSAPVDVADVLGSLANLWQAASDDKGVGFTLTVEPDFPQLISTDGQRLRQIVSNFISNALKFTDTGEISVTASHTHSAPGTFTVSITDTGIGLSAAEQAKLFQAFSQLHTGTARAFGGTGLGLAISKQMATLMGGDVSVVSAPGEGSTFSITLPLVILAAAEICEEEQEIELPAQCSILVAEDNPTNQAVVRALLGGFGWELSFVDNGAKAVEGCQTGQFDLILMDIHMPVMDGMEATRTIRGLQSEVAGVPIIALTADASIGDRTRFMSSGFDGHVAKPIEMETLLMSIAKVLAAKSLARNEAKEGDDDREPKVA